MNKFNKVYKIIIEDIKSSKRKLIKEENDQLADKENKMKVSELIAQLESLKEAHGDIEVKVLDGDSEPIEIHSVDYDSYEKSICICLPRYSIKYY